MDVSYPVLSMPSHGALSNPNDIAVIKELEDKMLEAFGNAVVTRACEAAGKTKKRKVNQITASYPLNSCSNPYSPNTNPKTMVLTLTLNLTLTR